MLNQLECIVLIQSGTIKTRGVRLSWSCLGRAHITGTTSSGGATPRPTALKMHEIVEIVASYRRGYQRVKFKHQEVSTQYYSLHQVASQATCYAHSCICSSLSLLFQTFLRCIITSYLAHPVVFAGH
jgi:hypothetical protein